MLVISRVHVPHLCAVSCPDACFRWGLIGQLNQPPSRLVLDPYPPHERILASKGLSYPSELVFCKSVIELLLTTASRVARRNFKWDLHSCVAARGRPSYAWLTVLPPPPPTLTIDDVSPCSLRPQDTCGNRNEPPLYSLHTAPVSAYIQAMFSATVMIGRDVTFKAHFDTEANSRISPYDEPNCPTINLSTHYAYCDGGWLINQEETLG